MDGLSEPFAGLGGAGAPADVLAGGGNARLGRGIPLRIGALRAGSLARTARRAGRAGRPAGFVPLAEPAGRPANRRRRGDS